LIFTLHYWRILLLHKAHFGVKDTANVVSEIMRGVKIRIDF